jgi:uncharacterized membrane protein
VTLGPIEMVVLGFPGSRFTGEITPAIVDLVDRQIVNLIDALFIAKEDNGDVLIVELEEMTDDPALNSLAGYFSSRLDLVSADDVDDLVDDLEPGSSALVLVFEHTWMRPVRDAIVNSGGYLIADVQVPGAVVDEVLAAIEAL